MIMNGLQKSTPPGQFWKPMPMGLSGMLESPQDMEPLSMPHAVMDKSSKPLKAYSRVANPFALSPIDQLCPARSLSFGRAVKLDSVTAS